MEISIYHHGVQIVYTGYSYYYATMKGLRLSKSYKTIARLRHYAGYKI